jgi:lipopolysaccharide export LptBFGC system permease protein LptF
MDKKWYFLNGSVQLFNDTGNRIGLPQPFKIHEMQKITETPVDFLNEIKDPAYKSSTELWEYIKTHQHLSTKTLTEYEVDFHQRLSMPFICLVIIAIGIPVGSHTGRKGAFAGIMFAIGMLFAFYATQFTMIYLAKQMYILPWIGPWGAIILFIIIGLLMIRRMR